VLNGEKKRTANIFLAFVDEVVLEALALLVRKAPVERVEKRRHRRRDHRLLVRRRRDDVRLFDIVGGEGAVFEAALDKLRELAAVFVGEGREILAARRELVGHSLAGEGFDQRIGREARFALLAVADQRRAGGFQAADGVRAGRVLFGDEASRVMRSASYSRIACWSRVERGSEPTCSVGMGRSFSLRETPLSAPPATIASLINRKGEWQMPL